MNQTQRTLQEYRSTLPPAEVLTRARAFFSRHVSIYAAFIDREGPTFVSFRGQGGEELIIAVLERDGATLVTGSSYLFDSQIARFFTTLAPFEESELLLASAAPSAGAVTAGAT
ncbi:MAG: hypothetical protein H0W68_08645 [Gemmatimonadaceae bacterium]|nr:hypothetical protein [Gemmatimonadaceae bacterium]